MADHPLLGAALAAVLSAPAAADRVVLVVHGGAGGPPDAMTADEQKHVRAALEQALRAGHAALARDTGTSLDAVEAAVRVLEDSPLFNAGRGAVFTRDGTVELDASIMEGGDKRAGAVAGVTTVKNPIAAARAVMEKSPHVLLAGRGAEAFAARHGVERAGPDYFRTEKRWQQLQEKLRKEAAGGGKHHGTVGAVALDRRGRLAAGTSTGGLTGKLPGRVGDSPLIGAGTYADDAACGVSCTGVGELFIRFAVAHDIAARVRYKGETAAAAADAVIHGPLKAAGGEGGVIALDPQGRVAAAFNGGSMTRGYITAGGRVSVAVGEPDWPPAR